MHRSIGKLRTTRIHMYMTANLCRPDRGRRFVLERSSQPRGSLHEWARNNQPKVWASNYLQMKRIARPEIGKETTQMARPRKSSGKRVPYRHLFLGPKAIRHCGRSRKKGLFCIHVQHSGERNGMDQVKFAWDQGRKRSVRAQNFIWQRACLVSRSATYRHVPQVSKREWMRKRGERNDHGLGKCSSFGKSKCRRLWPALSRYRKNVECEVHFMILFTWTVTSA
jgi:hypothetical protein